LKRAALDLGSCSDPSILFENGLDGRTTAAFIASNQKDFNHGSALNIDVIASFICGQLGSSCKAGADAIAACTAGQTAAGKFSPIHKKFIAPIDWLFSRCDWTSGG